MAQEQLDLDDIVDHDEGTDLKDADRGDDATDESAGEDAGGEGSDKDGDAGDKDGGKDGEDDSDKDADADADDGKDGGAPNPMIPRARLNAVQEKRRAAEARATEAEAKLEELQGKKGGEQLKEYTERLDTLYEDVEKARAEGDYKEAAKIQRELDKLKDSESATRSKYVAQQEALAVQQRTAHDAVVDQVELLVPELNPSDDAFDGDLLEDVMAVRDGYESRNVAPAAALKKALKYVLGKDIFSDANMRKQTAAPPRKTDVKKNVAAAKKTPPDLQSGAPAEKKGSVDVTNLSEEEFDKLPEATRSRLRGDFLE